MTLNGWKPNCRVGFFALAVAALCASGTTCPQQQTNCGNGTCDTGETNANCPADCPPPAACGDGTVDAGEQCDDGNTTNGDGCSSTCQNEPQCGDGTLDPGEGCDDGNTVSGDGCSAVCTVEASCGDGNVDAGEQCDDGAANSDTTPDACRTTCANPSCGDNVVDTGEQCDDGNTTAGDGCSPTCQNECGDGVCGAGETTANCPADCPTVLFVADFAGKNVVSFENPASLNSLTAPVKTNLTDLVGLNFPADLIVTANGSLVVSNFGGASLTRYNDAVTVTGNTPANATLTDTTGPALTFPASLTVNLNQDLVFVANLGAPLAIRVYDSASGLGGNIQAVRINTSTSLVFPTGINFGAGDDLYVANGTNVLVFANASTRPTSSLPADRVIASASFTNAFDVFVDNADNLLVINNAGATQQVLVFPSASTLNLPAAPTPLNTLTVAGASLTAVVVGSDGTGYVVDQLNKRVLVWDDIVTRSGNPPPDRTFSNIAMSDPIRAFLLEP